MKWNILGLRGRSQAQLSGAYPESFLNACAMNGFELWNMNCVDSCTVHFNFYEKDTAALSAIAEKSMCQLKTETLSGGSRLFDFVKRHLGLFITLLACLVILSISSFFIWDMEVYGNKKLSDGEILRTLAACGVDYGTFAPWIDKELLRSQMLTQLPELAWMTVNVRGSKAQVLVSERQEKPEIYMESRSADLIAKKTGIIKNIFARNGKVLVMEGSSVIEGETLISGCMDSITAQPRYVRSQGEIMAETWYELCSVCPEDVKMKIERKRPKLRLALKIGQTRLNFYFGGRKTVDGYDKIIDNYIVGVEGVFSLPLSLVVERIIPYEAEIVQKNDSEAAAGRISQYLEGQMEGEILSESITAAERDGLVIVSLRAACLENIAELSEYTEFEDIMP